MKQYHLVSRVAIYLLSVVLFAFGVFHFIHPHDLLVFVPTFMPGGIIWVYFVGASFILVALSFLTNRMVKLSGYVLAALLAISIVTVHVPNLNAADKDERQRALINLLKDAAIVGFALHIAAGAHNQKLHLEDSD